ncbi:MAG: hypothetical protein AAFR17_05110 [Pseudomonadota bacterium]
MLTIIFYVIAIFSGIAVGMGTLFSIGQSMLSTGWTRAAHLFGLVSMLAVMWFLLEREPGVARLLSPVALAGCVCVFLVERGWYKILPILQIVFVLLVFFGFVFTVG